MFFRRKMAFWRKIFRLTLPPLWTDDVKMFLELSLKRPLVSCLSSQEMFSGWQRLQNCIEISRGSVKVQCYYILTGCNSFSVFAFKQNTMEPNTRWNVAWQVGIRIGTEASLIWSGKYICINWKIYFLKFWNVFVQIANCWVVVRNLPYRVQCAVVHWTAPPPSPASDAKKIYENIVQVIKINWKLISPQIGLQRNGAILELHQNLHWQL